MRDEYVVKFHEAVKIVCVARDTCNRLMEFATDKEIDGPVYQWAHNAYHDLLLVLSDAFGAREREP